jgi:hypothetical protein
LTDEDLNRLDHYMVAKNKLHNRYLHGWGVVCGLEVVCHPCPGEVTVRSGYALSPCGDDIVVCKDTRVNVCELLKKCRDDMRHWECEPVWTRQEPDCNPDQPWVLYVCYDEKPSRGITALRASSEAPCCSRCSCGGSSTCGCACHEKLPQTKTNGEHRAAKRTPPQCEPTILCEGYSFKLRKLAIPTPTIGKATTKKAEVDEGAMVNRMKECLTQLQTIQQRISGLPRQAIVSNVNDIREELLLLMEHDGITNCESHGKLRQPVGKMKKNEALSYFAPFIVEAMRECLCSALIPPCPEPVDDNCVPLAKITLNCENGCHVQKICNWGNRRIVPTVPAIQYWLEGLIPKTGLGEFVEDFCCGQVVLDHGTPTTAGISIEPNNLTATFMAFTGRLKTLVKDFLT